MRLGEVADDSVAATLCALVRHGAQQRPELAAAICGSVLLRLVDGYAHVRIDFRGDEIEVSDDDADVDPAPAAATRRSARRRSAATKPA